MRNIFLLGALLLLILSSCNWIGGERVRGNGNLVTQERNVGNFQGIRSHGFFDIYLTNGPVPSVKVDAEENIQQHIITQVDGNVLKIETEDGIWLRPRRDVRIYISSPSFSEVKVFGSGNIISEGRISSSNKMEVAINGSGDIRVELNAPEVKADISGSGNINLQGNVKKFDAQINGSGDIKAMELVTEETHIGINGSGNAEVYANAKMDIDVRGSGDVRYKGPAHVTSDIKGSGSVKKID